jgi:hypothetical protein
MLPWLYPLVAKLSPPISTSPGSIHPSMINQSLISHSITLSPDVIEPQLDESVCNYDMREKRACSRSNGVIVSWIQPCKPRAGIQQRNCMCKSEVRWRTRRKSTIIVWWWSAGASKYRLVVPHPIGMYIDSEIPNRLIHENWDTENL